MKLNTLAIIYQNIIKLYDNYFNLLKIDNNSKSVIVSIFFISILPTNNHEECWGVSIIFNDKVITKKSNYYKNLLIKVKKFEKVISDVNS